MIAVLIAVSWLGWASTVVVPLLLVCIPLLWAHVNNKLNKLDTRNTSQHADAQALRHERFNALEARIDRVLEMTADTNDAVHDTRSYVAETNRKIDEHLRDHLKGVA